MPGAPPTFRPTHIESRYRGLPVRRMSQDRTRQDASAENMADSQSRPARSPSKNDMPPEYTSSDPNAAYLSSTAKKSSGPAEAASSSSQPSSDKSNEGKGMWQKVKTAACSKKTEEEKLRDEEKKRQREQDYERLNMKDRVVFGQSAESFRLQ